MKRTIFSIGSLMMFGVASVMAQEEPTPDFGSDVGPTLLQLAGALLLIIIIIYASVWLMKRYTIGKSAAGGELIKVVDRRYLTPKQTIYVVKVGEKHILIGATESGINKLCDVEIAPPPAPSLGGATQGTVNSRFSQFLKQAKESLMPRQASAESETSR
jgi:flagellar biosynthetic protein FliO